MKKSYKGFPVYGLVIFFAFMAWQMFTSTMGGHHGTTIEYTKMLEHIEQGVIAQVALQEDSVYARLNSSTIPEDQFSEEKYDFTATVSPEAFVDACRQLAARKAGVPAEEISDLDLGFKLI